jgi:hypothetical protein
MICCCSLVAATRIDGKQWDLYPYGNVMNRNRHDHFLLMRRQTNDVVVLIEIEAFSFDTAVLSNKAKYHNDTEVSRQDIKPL